MAQDDTPIYVLLVVAVVAVIGLALALSSFATDRAMMGGGGMMGGTGGTAGTTTGPGALEWAVLVLSIAFFAIAVVLLLRGRGTRANAPTAVATALPAAAPGPVAPEPAPIASSPGPAEAATAAPAATVPEPTLVKLLDEDERRMYLEIRAHGGAMLQRDLVASRMFSKAKVTRVLDKLEAKGVVVREAHGMTNRVRLTAGAAR